MNTSIRIAAVLALVLAGQALAQSTVEYTVELGGNNHASDGEESYEAGYYPQYTRNDTDQSEVNQGDTVNWAVAVTISGTHSDPGGWGDGLTPVGLANAVFDLALVPGTNPGGTPYEMGHAEGTSNVPTSPGWFSTINDGDADGSRGGGGADPLENAAYPSVFNIGGGGGAGRLSDPDGDSGPGLEYFHYPSASKNDPAEDKLPASATIPCHGKLVGMGAGYPWFSHPANAGTSTPGVGLEANVEACTALCTGDPVDCQVLFEGQISTEGLPAGTYTLVVLPSAAGTNILPYTTDICSVDVDPTKFAVQANNLIGDYVTFSVLGPEPPALLVIPSNQDVASTAGSTSFSVTNTGGGSLSYSAACSVGCGWLSIGSGGSGTAPADIVANYVANTGGTRVGWLHVASNGGSQDVSVSQDCAALSIVSSVSRKFHGSGAAGAQRDFDKASGGYEGRIKGTSAAGLGPTKIVTVFNQGVQRFYNTASDVSVTSGTFGSITISTGVVTNDTVTVNLTSIANKAKFRIWYPGIVPICHPQLDKAATVCNCWQVMGGECSGGSGSPPKIWVSGTDVSSVIAQISAASTVGSGNFHKELNCNGSFAGADASIAIARIDLLTKIDPTCNCSP